MTEFAEQTRSWSNHQRTAWRIKWATVISTVVAVCTALGTCGADRLLGVKMASDSKVQHEAIETRVDARLARMEASLDRITDRLDRVLEVSNGKRKR